MFKRQPHGSLIIAALIISFASVSAARQPHVVFILADDSAGTMSDTTAPRSGHQTWTNCLQEESGWRTTMFSLCAPRPGTSWWPGDTRWDPHPAGLQGCSEINIWNTKYWVYCHIRQWKVANPHNWETVTGYSLAFFSWKNDKQWIYYLNYCRLLFC